MGRPGEKSCSEVRAELETLAFYLPGCAILGKWLNTSEPQYFLNLYKVNINVRLIARYSMTWSGQSVQHDAWCVDSTWKILTMNYYCYLSALHTSYLSHHRFTSPSSGSEVVIHSHAPTQIGQLACVPGTLCPCALIPSWHWPPVPISRGSTQSFLCLFVLFLFAEGWCHSFNAGSQTSGSVSL